MRKKIPKYKKIPERIIQMKKEADTLLDEGHYQAAILYYALFTEQIILTAYLYIIREENIDEAIRIREDILSKKEKRKFALGDVIYLTKRKIDGRLLTKYLSSTEAGIENAYDLIDKIRKIRNMISAHPHFLLMIDPTNFQKRAMKDTNYYRKVIRRIKKFMQNEIGIEPSPEIYEFLDFGHPLTLSTYMDENLISLENSINKSLANYCRFASEEIAEQMRVAFN